MSQGTVLYRFRFQVSDIDRGVYEAIDFRLALHPSESLSFMLTRAIAYGLNFGEGLQFSGEGLANPDEPCLSSENPRGGKALWIEVGSPSARRLHKAAKAAQRVKVYTYRNPEAWLREVDTGEIYNAEKVEIFSLPLTFLEALEATLARDNEWGLFHDQGALLVNRGDDTYQAELRSHYLRRRS